MLSLTYPIHGCSTSATSFSTIDVYFPLGSCSCCSIHFGKDILHACSANKIQLNLPRPILHEVLILSSLTTQAVSLNSGHMDLAQLTFNILKNYYFFTILCSAWSLIYHSKKLLVCCSRPEKKREKRLLLYEEFLNIEIIITVIINFIYILKVSNHSHLKTLAYIQIFHVNKAKENPFLLSGVKHERYSGFESGFSKSFT